MTRDLITGLVCLIASLALLACTIGLPGPSLLVPVGPGFYPRIVLGICAVLSAALVVQAFIARKRTAKQSAEASEPTRPNYALVVASFAVFGIYIAAMPYLGYRVATFAFMLAFQPLLEAPRGMRGWIVALVVAVVTSFVTFHLFQDYLAVLLPRGRWTDF